HRKADHALDPSGLQQMLHHVEHDQRTVAEIGEALPGLGCEQHRQPGRMAEKISPGRLHALSLPCPGLVESRRRFRAAITKRRMAAPELAPRQHVAVTDLVPLSMFRCGT